MRFSREELVAILKMGQTMTLADGRIDPNEAKVVITQLLRFGLSKEQAMALVKEGNAIEGNKALAILSNLDDEKKRYVSSYLGAIMVSDGEIDEKELALWKLISTLCDFPPMNIVDALNNMANL